MNKIISILYRGLTEEEIMERLDNHNVKYVWRFGGRTIQALLSMVDILQNLLIIFVQKYLTNNSNNVIIIT